MTPPSVTGTYYIRSKKQQSRDRFLGYNLINNALKDNWSQGIIGTVDTNNGRSIS
jgi:hypothetical protein